MLWRFTDNGWCFYRGTLLSSSGSSDESEIGANSNDDAVDGEKIALYSLLRMILLHFIFVL